MKHLIIIAIAAIAMACYSSKKAETPEPAPQPASASDADIAPGSGSNNKSDGLFLYLERTPCFGMCKAYRLEVKTDGSATYTGRGNVELMGAHTATVPQESIKLIRAKAEELGFRQMDDKYDAEVTDLPSTVLRLVLGGKPKQVLGRVGQPAAFKQLVAYIEELLLPLDWKPVASDR